MGSTQLSPIWLRVVRGRPNQQAERSAGLPTALLLPTSGKDDDTEPLGGTAPQSLDNTAATTYPARELIGFLSCSGQRSLGSGPNEPFGWEAPHGWVDVSPRRLQDVSERKRGASLSPIVADVAALPGEEGQVPAAQPGVTAQPALPRLAAQPPAERSGQCPNLHHASGSRSPIWAAHANSLRPQPQFQCRQTRPIMGWGG